MSSPVCESCPDTNSDSSLDARESGEEGATLLLDPAMLGVIDGVTSRLLPRGIGGINVMRRGGGGETEAS